MTRVFKVHAKLSLTSLALTVSLTLIWSPDGSCVRYNKSPEIAWNIDLNTEKMCALKSTLDSDIYIFAQVGMHVA